MRLRMYAGIFNLVLGFAEIVIFSKIESKF